MLPIVAQVPGIYAGHGFKTVQAYAGDLQLNDPVIDLNNQSDGIVLEFDELASERRYLRWRAVHCNRDFTRSSLLEDEYMDGFNDVPVEDVTFSRATTVQYVHYRIAFPGESVTLKASGNYLVEVYDEGNPEEVLLRVPVFVSEQKVNASLALTSRTDVDYNCTHQQLSVALDTRNLPTHFSFSDITLVATQNDRRDRVALINHPTRVSGSELIYEHIPSLIWEGANEYRRFETLLTQSPGLNIAETGYRLGSYWAYVGPDEPREGSSYLYDSTQQGKYFVREYNSIDSSTEADYITVVFTLAMPEVDGEVHIEGELTGRSLGEDSRMEFDAGSGCYRKALLLKQGSYNYSYVLKQPDGSTLNSIDGNHYQTVNKYTVYVYLHLPGDRYDRLAGYYTISNEQ